MTPASFTSPDAPAICPAPEDHAVRVQLSERLAQLEKRVVTDPLTGLWNRNHFDHVIRMELDRSLRHKQPLSLILFDIDHFKGINDRFGHQVGDQVLHELAVVAKAAIRSSDVIFRWGGEEFAMLAISSGYRSARRQAESLRSRVAAHEFPVIGSLTISLGVAEHTASESAGEWFRRADDRLYAAKHDGRNAVRVDACGNSDMWAAEHGLSALHLVWQEAYECGEPTVDREHRELFDLANDLIDAFLSAGSDFARIAPIFDRLLRHVVGHFADEEVVLERHGYAKLDAHRRIHARLLDRARELHAAFEAGAANLGSVAEFLAAEVVAHHLFGADRDFFPLFAGRTVSDSDPA